MAMQLEVKKRIRALLVSSKGGSTPKQLFQDYREVIGEDIPFSKLGYRSLMAFIHDMADVVSVKVNRDGRKMLYAVPDPRTQHIARMVSKQRTSRPGGSQPAPPRRNPQPRKIPDAFNTQLKQLFLCYPNGISLERFNEAFARRFGYYLRFHPWGYTSLEQLLADAADVELVCDPLKGSSIVKPRRKKELTLEPGEKGLLGAVHQMPPAVPPEESLHGLETSPVKEKSFSVGAKVGVDSENEGGEKEEVEAPVKPVRPPVPDRLIRNIQEVSTTS